MKLALTEVYEVATFYAHFDVVKEDETPPPPVTVRVCDSLSCAMAGAEKLLATLPAKLGPGVRVVRAPCMGACDRAPVCAVGHVQVMEAGERSVGDAVARHVHAHAHKPQIDFAAYRAAGGYRLLGDCLSGKRTRDDIIKIVSDADLRGLGGAGFPTGRKWTLVRQAPAPRLMAVNGDEGEPGTFKDRYYLGLDPHRFIEGMLLAAWVVEAADIYVYIRDEYPELILMLAEEFARVAEAGLAKHATIHLRRGAGAYICGEESAMIESIEGKRGLPRHRPPYVAQVGLFGRPTLEQNVETLYWVRDIVEKRRRVVRVARAARTQGLPLILRLRPREEAGRGAGARGRHGARADRGILRRHDRRPCVQGLSAGRRFGRHPARLDGGRAAWTSARWKNTAASSVPTRLSSCPRRTT